MFEYDLVIEFPNQPSLWRKESYPTPLIEGAHVRLRPFLKDQDVVIRIKQIISDPRNTVAILETPSTLSWKEVAELCAFHFHIPERKPVPEAIKV